jgi:hypothetical protein
MPLPLIIPVLTAIGTMLGGAAALNQTMNPPKSKTQTPVAPSGGGGQQAQDVFGQGIPSLGSMMVSANQGQSPKAPAAPTMPQGLMGDPAALKQQLASNNQATLAELSKNAPMPGMPAAGPDIAGLLAAAPEAIAAMAPLLGLLQGDKRRTTQAIGAQGGGGGGQMVAGLNLPQHATITQLLQALPRPRYG